ncbi:MAG: redoxin domain-containing protein [Planctomycetota bacterium]|nr:MAG: redoxin domain-containing protein [Planctomycetota bacterium]
MNELQEKYGAKGLSVLAVTSEAKSETEKWVAEKGAHYAYAYDKGGALARYFGVSGIPAAALVNAQGVVVWRGHPGALPSAQIESALVGALSKPLFEWPKSADAARGAFGKRDFAGALAAADKLAPADKEIADAIRGYVDAQIQLAASALEQGNLLLARDLSARLTKELGKHALAARTKELSEQVAKTANAAEIIAAIEAVQKLELGKLKKKKEGEKALDELKRIVKELPDTYAEKVARAKMDDLARILPGLK